MRRIILLIAVAALLPGIATAQLDRPYTGQGYFFVAPGAASPGNWGTLHFGGGGQGFVYKGLGIGAELGLLAPRECIREGIGVFSANGSYHFNRSAKLVPFVTGGYSLGFRSGVINGMNFGVGVEYWFKPRVGLHLEFRDHLQPQYISDGHLWGIRIGVALR